MPSDYLSVAFVWAMATASIASLILLPQPRTPVRGWRILKPSALHWTGICLGTGLTCLFSYIWTFVGSSRPDGERQMTILFWLIMAFGFLSVMVGREMRAIVDLSIRWRGERLIYSSKGADLSYDFEDVAGLTRTAMGRTVVTFADGAILRIDPYATTAEDLIERLEERLAARGPQP